MVINASHFRSCSVPAPQVWDALQASLRHTGELHNNARMGWGKAVVGWSEGPEVRRPLRPF